MKKINPVTKSRLRKANPNQKYTEDQLWEAKQLYLKHSKIADIVKATGVNKNSIMQYAAKGWRKERDDRTAEAQLALFQSKAGTMSEIVKYGLDTIKVAIQNLLCKANELSVKEVAQLMTTIEKADKILKLDKGEATEITANNPLGRSEVIEVVNPFLETKELDEIEITPLRIEND
jgi:hypothetical protein